MLKSIQQFYGLKLGASDGEIGHVKDFYFDDQNWAIRYLVADTGTWLPGRLVLLSPHSLGRLNPAGKVLRANLTRKQIEQSPAMESHKPVSRQYEEEYYKYYGWPFYWQGDALWGMSGFPILERPQQSFPNEQSPSGADAHLRSAQTVKGYCLHASDGTIGHVCDFMMDPRNWAIAQLVIKTGHRFSGREVNIPTDKVARISYEESAVFVNMTKAEVEQSPAPHQVPTSAAA